jgi:hypothetical protein
MMIRPTEITTNEWDQNLIKVNLDSDMSKQDKETILSICREIIDLHNIDSYFDVELSIVFLNQNKENDTELISYREIHGT